MKAASVVLTLAVCFALAGEAYAQRSLQGMQGIQVTGGMADGSAIAGYETSNRGEKTLFDGSTLNSKDAFIYGGTISLELETCLTDRLVLLLTGRERFLWGTSTGHFHTQFGIGLKYMIN